MLQLRISFRHYSSREQNAELSHVNQALGSSRIAVGCAFEVSKINHVRQLSTKKSMQFLLELSQTLKLQHHDRLPEPATEVFQIDWISKLKNGGSIKDNQRLFR